MAFLLDTNVVSELRRPRPHGAVLAWLESTDDIDLHLASVTIGEIQAGIKLTREQDPGKARVIELGMAWPEEAMIVAIAKEHQLTVVTRTVTDFHRFEVPLLNPFTR